jgi:hypothetical protein
MFVEELRQIDVENEFLPPICQTTVFSKVRMNGESVLFFGFKDLRNSKVTSLLLYDFKIENIQKADYPKFMYDIFGEPYKKEYIKYLEKQLFN